MGNTKKSKKENVEKEVVVKEAKKAADLEKTTADTDGAKTAGSVSAAASFARARTREARSSGVAPRQFRAKGVKPVEEK